MPLTAGTDVWGNNEHPYNASERARIQRLGRPPSSKGAILRASTWFDDVAAPRMQQMHKVQKDAVKGHDQELERKVQQLTESLCQVSHLSCHPVYVCYRVAGSLFFPAPFAGLLQFTHQSITHIIAFIHACIHFSLNDLLCCIQSHPAIAVRPCHPELSHKVSTHNSSVTVHYSCPASFNKYQQDALDCMRTVVHALGYVVTGGNRWNNVPGWYLDIFQFLGSLVRDLASHQIDAERCS